MSYPTRSDVSQCCADFKAWLRRQGLGGKPARDYARCVRAVEKHTSGYYFTAENVEKVLKVNTRVYRTAWAGKNGFMAYWAQREKEVTQACGVLDVLAAMSGGGAPKPTKGSPMKVEPISQKEFEKICGAPKPSRQLPDFSQLAEGHVDAVKTDDQGHLHVTMCIARNSNLAKMVLEGLPLRLVPADPTKQPRYTDEDLQQALEEDRGKEGRAGRDSARNILKEIIGRLLGKTKTEVNDIARYSHAKDNELKDFILELVQAQASYRNGLNLVYETLLGAVPEDLGDGAGRKAQAILKALPQKDLIEEILGDKPSDESGLLTFTNSLLMGLARVFDTSDVDTGIAWKPEMTSERIIESIHRIRTKQENGLVVAALQRVAEKTLGLKLPPGLSPEMLEQHIQHKVSDLQGLSTGGRRWEQTLWTVYRMVVESAPPGTASPEGIIGAVQDKVKAIQSEAVQWRAALLNINPMLGGEPNGDATPQRALEIIGALLKERDLKTLQAGTGTPTGAPVMWEQALRSIAGLIGGDDWTNAETPEEIRDETVALVRSLEQRERLCVLSKLAGMMGDSYMEVVDDAVGPEGVGGSHQDVEHDVLVALVKAVSQDRTAPEEKPSGLPYNLFKLVTLLGSPLVGDIASAPKEAGTTDEAKTEYIVNLIVEQWKEMAGWRQAMLDLRLTDLKYYCPTLSEQEVAVVSLVDAKRTLSEGIRKLFLRKTASPVSADHVILAMAARYGERTHLEVPKSAVDDLLGTLQVLLKT